MNVDAILNIRAEGQNLIKQVSQDMEQFGHVSQQTRSEIRQFSTDVHASDRVLNTMRASIKNQTQDLQLAANAFQSVSSMVSKVMGMYTQYNVMQIRVAQAQDSMRDAQQRYNEAVAKFGADSSQAITAQGDLEMATRKAGQAQSEATMQLVGFGLMVPSFLGNILKIRTEFATMAAAMNLTNWAGWSAAATTAINAVKTALVPLTGILTAVYVAISSIQFHQMTAEALKGAELTAREYSALQRVMSDTGLSVGQLIEKFQAGTLDISDWGEIAVSAINKVNEAYKKIQLPKILPPEIPDVKPPDTTQAVASIDNLKNAVDQLAAVRGLITIDADITKALTNINRVYDALESLHDKSVTVSVNYIQGVGGIPSFQHGGVMPYTGPAYLHAGERVLTPAQQSITTHMTNYNQISSNMDLDVVQKRIETAMVSGYNRLRDIK
jgi:hypothetical protein